MSLLRRTRRPHRSRNHTATGFLVLGILALVTTIVLSGRAPFVAKPGTVYRAEFESARQVNSDTPVRVKGVKVGQVESMTYDAQRRLTVVAFRVTDDDVKLRTDASAALRWRTLLGGRMELALEPGSPLSAESRTGRIVVSRTRNQTEVEDVSRVLRGSGATGMKAFLTETPKALSGASASQLIDGLPQLEPLASAARALRGHQDDDLSALVLNSARTSLAFANAQASLVALIDGAEGTLRTVAADREELRQTFRLAPAALAQTRRATRAVDAALPDLDRLVTDLRPGARALAPALQVVDPTARRLSRTLRRALPLVRELRPAVRALGAMATSGRRLLTALAPTTKRLLDDLLPYLERTDADVQLPVYQTIGPTIATLNAAAGQFSGAGHIINFPVQPGEGSQGLLPCATSLTDPTVAEKVRCTQLDEALGFILGAPPRGKR